MTAEFDPTNNQTTSNGVELPDYLHYVSDDYPGFSRKKHGRGFIYFDEFHEKLKNEAELKRIKALVIPPFWKNVWICPSPNGYLQVTGKDARNRKQYLYHIDWTNYRQAVKFRKIVEFGKKLPQIRQQYQKDLKQNSWTKTKVTALTLYLLDNYYFRIGNQYYANQNETYGLTTLRRKHLHADTDGLSLEYKAKSGKIRKVKIDNSKIAKLVRETSALPGYEIFRYKNDVGGYAAIESKDVNDYLHKHSSEKFSAKDFRTWGATKTAIECYQRAVEKISENTRLKFEPTLIKLVAKVMGNTPTVCKKYYIHPTVLETLAKHYPKPVELLPACNTNLRYDEYESIVCGILCLDDKSRAVSA